MYKSYVYDCFVFMYISVPGARVVPKGAIREFLVSLEVEGQVVVNHHEGAEN